MPRYDYKCRNESCGKTFEITHSILDEPKIDCPVCQSFCTRQISKNVMFETPMDVEWEKDPSDLTQKSLDKFNKAKKKKFRW